MPMRDPSQSSRGQEKAQVIVTPLVTRPCPASAPSSIENNMILHLDLSIAVKIRTKFFRSSFHPVDTPSLKANKHCASELIFLCSFLLLNLPVQMLLVLPHALKSFLLGAQTHKPKLIGTESLRTLRHKPLFHAQCQIGAKTVCSYS